MVKKTWSRPAFGNGNRGSWERPTVLCWVKRQVGGRRWGDLLSYRPVDSGRSAKPLATGESTQNSWSTKGSGKRGLIFQPTVGFRPTLHVASETTHRPDAFLLQNSVLVGFLAIAASRSSSNAGIVAIACHSFGILYNRANSNYFLELIMQRFYGRV